MAEIKVTMEFEPYVKMLCFNQKCRFNMMNNARWAGVFCSLKCVEINDTGKCRQYEPKEDDHSAT